MKTFSLIFIIFVFWLLLASESKASTPNDYAYCAGYSDKMFQTYRIKYYKDMQNFFSQKVLNKPINSLTAEYYQSGFEFVKDKHSIKDNIHTKCENYFKGKIL